MDAINITIRGHTLSLPEELWELLPDGQAVQLRLDKNGVLIVTPLDDDDLAELPGLQRLFEEALEEPLDALPLAEALADIDRERNAQ
jgi:hypothetical protein